MKLTPERIRALFSIHYPSGSMHWKEGTTHPNAGSICGELKDGDMVVKVDGDYYNMNTIAYVYHYGVWPDAPVARHSSSLDFKSDNLTLTRKVA